MTEQFDHQRAVMPYRSVAKKLKQLIEDPDTPRGEFEKEVTRLKYSQSMRLSAKYHFEQSRKGANR